jgi:protein ImuB
VLELVALRLEALEQAHALGSGVIQVQLQLDEVAPIRDQLELFPQNPQRDPRAASAALARVRALFGDDAVVRAKLADGHLPEARAAWGPWGDVPFPAETHARTVLQRPLVRRVFERPVPLSSQRRNEPDGWMILGLEGGPVREVLGPYRVSGGWWVREVQREYHYIRTDRTGWLWVYFDRRRRRWFAQGIVE